jgi:hypothetical protein
MRLVSTKKLFCAVTGLTKQTSTFLRGFNMSFITGGSKAAKQSSAAAAEQQRLQSEQLARQEKQVQSEQSELAKRTQSTLRARQRGGQRMLMGDMDEQSTLG